MGLWEKPRNKISDVGCTERAEFYIRAPEVYSLFIQVSCPLGCPAAGSCHLLQGEERANRVLDGEDLNLRGGGAKAVSIAKLVIGESWAQPGSVPEEP